jgi:hypothetical protein
MRKSAEGFGEPPKPAREPRVFPRQSTRRYRSSFLRDDLSAGSFGCGNDFLEALITAQTIPAQIEAQIAV